MCRGPGLRCNPSGAELARHGWPATDEVVQGRSSQMMLRKCGDIRRGARAQTELGRRRRRSKIAGCLVTWTPAASGHAVFADEPATSTAVRGPARELERPPET